MRSSIFPDVNVWLALNYGPHIHNPAAIEWYASHDPSSPLVICRHTQLGLFRLLSTAVVMKDDVLNQPQCWRIFDHWIQSNQATFVQEPVGIESHLRLNAHLNSPSPKAWADDYLAAFAESGGLTLITFDRALAGKAKGAVLLS